MYKVGNKAWICSCDQFFWSNQTFDVFNISCTCKMLWDIGVLWLMNSSTCITSLCRITFSDGSQKRCKYIVHRYYTRVIVLILNYAYCIYSHAYVERPLNKEVQQGPEYMVTALHYIQRGQTYVELQIIEETQCVVNPQPARYIAVC